MESDDFLQASMRAPAAAPPLSQPPFYFSIHFDNK